MSTLSHTHTQLHFFHFNTQLHSCSPQEKACTHKQIGLSAALTGLLAWVCGCQWCSHAAWQAASAGVGVGCSTSWVGFISPGLWIRQLYILRGCCRSRMTDWMTDVHGLSHWVYPSVPQRHRQLLVIIFSIMNEMVSVTDWFTSGTRSGRHDDPV